MIRNPHHDAAADRRRLRRAASEEMDFGASIPEFGGTKSRNPGISSSEMVDELILRKADGSERRLELRVDRYTIGRALTNDLAYPDDGELSRQHLAFERSGSEWWVVDLGSRNGTRVNGVRIGRPSALKGGDRVSAGKLTIECRYAGAPADVDMSTGGSVVFTEGKRGRDQTSTVSRNLEEALSGATSFGARVPQSSLTGSRDRSAAPRTTASQMRALIEAGRELAEHRPLTDLFRLILDLAAKAIGCSRGVLLLQESGSLVARAAMGSNFEISKTVCERVLKQKESLLISDARQDDEWRRQASIISQSIRSIIAVPLQAKDKVIGLIYLDSARLARRFTPEELELVTVMANIAAIRIENARLMEVENHEQLMAREMAQAAEIQRSLLPRSVPRLPGLELAAFSAPCLSVGGDHYDIYERGGKVILLVADVAGKGLPAALLAAGLHARIQVLMEDEADLAALVTRINRIIARNCPGNRFITFFVCEVDPIGGELTYVNAGHNPPLLVRGNGEVLRLDGGGTVLGIFGRAAYSSHSAQMDDGDLLVMFSDGVTEAEDPSSQEQFGEERLLETLNLAGYAHPAEMIEGLKQAVTRHAGSVSAADDFTLVMAKKTPSTNR